LKVALPSLPEQQKIAECLSSVDDLMTAQARKVAALKTHKKGLIQQLFPREGETHPRRRFPEFQNAGAWEVKSLGDICHYWNGGSNEGAITENGEYYLISLNSIDIDGNLKADMKRLSKTDHSLKKNDLIMVLSDVAHGNFLGLTDIIPNEMYVLNQRMAGLRLKNDSVGNVVFLRVFINKKQRYFKQKGQGSSQQNLAKSAVTEFPVVLPCQEEQQRIADCVTTVDALITAETQKHEALKTHKKGLMQQLFPSPEAVEV
jgi:type I restriction enzyme S subunit